MWFGLVLILDDDAAARVVSMSRQIGDTDGVLMVLGQKAPPHVSLAHFRSSERVARDIYRQVAHGEEDIVLEGAGFVTRAIPENDFYLPDGGWTASAEIRLDEPLQALFEHASEHLHHRQEVAPVAPRSAPYWPHITLAVYSSKAAATLEPAPDTTSIVSRGHVALGVLGPFGTFPTIIDATTR